MKTKKHEPPQRDDDTGLKWAGEFVGKVREMIDTDGHIYEDIYGKRKKKSDYAFLEKNPNEGKKRHISYMGRVAVIAVSVLVAGSGIGIWMNSQPANALKFEAQKKLYETEDGFATDEDAGETSAEEVINIDVTEMKDIDKAKRVMPNLPVPEYIPAGYELELLTVAVDKKRGTNGEYFFKQGNKGIWIAVIGFEEKIDYQIKAEGELVQEGGREIYIWEDTHAESFGCSFIIDTLEISIVGNISREEMIEIAKNLQ